MEPRKTRDEVKRAKWLTWLAEIRNDLTGIVTARAIWDDLHKIVDDNPNLQVSSYFWEFLKDGYVAHTIMGIRRQIKIGDGSVSLLGILSSISKDPKVLSRDWFVSEYAGTGVEDDADSVFDKFGAGLLYVDPIPIQADIAAIKSLSLKCEALADKTIAHRDAKQPQDLPTFEELHNCIALLDKTYCKYHLLLEFIDWDTLMLDHSHDWRAIFRVPWIAP